jgi:hypothetical protein
MRDANIHFLNAKIKFTGVGKKTRIRKCHLPVNLKALILEKGRCISEKAHGTTMSHWLSKLTH